MKSFNIHDAKTHLSKLVSEAANGNSFVIARAGKPLVKVVPIGAPASHEIKRIGFLSGAAKIKVPSQEVFDQIGAKEIAAMFGGDGQ